MNSRLLVLVGIILAAAIYRVLPHPPNFSPVAAMALFAGAYLADKRLALIVPFVALLLSDLILGLHDTMIFVYGAFAITVAMGFMLRRYSGVMPIALTAVASSILFFVVTNFGAWMMGTLYAKTFDGLVASYVAGIPFFQSTLLGNLIFTAIMFGGYELIKAKLLNSRVVSA